MNHPKDLWNLLRPKHWIKSAFVFTGLLFGSQYANLTMLFKVIGCAVAFALASSAIYIFNDICDAQNDQYHPSKKGRPLPSGLVTLHAASFLSCAVGICGLVLGLYISTKVFAIIAAYLLLNIAYSLRLKNAVILDVFCIAAGFMLRILAGTIGVGIPPSNWLLLCGLMITLFLGFAKRSAELIALKNKKSEHRSVLKHYSAPVLNEFSAICATGVIISYSLYTMNEETIKAHHTSNLIYTVPFVIYGLFRYIYLLHHCQSGGDPTSDLIGDWHIGISVICWAALTLYFII